MPTMILIAFAVAAVVVLGVAIFATFARLKEQRESGPDAPRTAEERVRDRQTASIWGIVLVLVLIVLVGAYLLTR